MMHHAYGHARADRTAFAPADSHASGQDPKATGTGGPRAGEDEPESTRDNDRKVEETSHKGTQQNPDGCDEHSRPPEKNP